MSEISRQILIVGPSWVGDMIMAQSLFKTIKQRVENSKISVLAPAWTHAILNRMPEIDVSVEMPIGHGKLNIRSRRQLAEKIKAHGYEQAIILPGSFKSALVPFWAKISRRTGYLGEQRYLLLNDIYKLDKQALPTTVERFVNLAGQHRTLADCPRPKLIVANDIVPSAITGFDYRGSDPLLILCPGAEYGPAKRWPVQRYAELAAIKSKQGWQVWLMGSEKDSEICNVINSLSGDQCRNLAGKTSLIEAIDLISLASVVVTNDSGLMHLAAALDRPVVALYGSSSPLMTPPLTDKLEIIWLQPDCGPCFKRDCPLGHLKCLNDINVAMVDDAVNNLKKHN